MMSCTSIGVLAGLVAVTIASDARAWCNPADNAQSISALNRSGLPPNIVVSSDLEPILAQMLRASPTFRRQCRRLGLLQKVRISVLLEPRPTEVTRRIRALGDLARHEFGGISANVRVWSREDASELIAHEFEHVIETAEGMNYRAVAMLHPRQVWVSDGGRFETARAIDAGLQVKRDVAYAMLNVGR